MQTLPPGKQNQKWIEVHPASSRMHLMYKKRLDLPLFILFCNVIWRDLDGYTITARIIGLLRLCRCHEIVCDGLNQALYAVPASRIAVGVELLTTFAVIDVEDVILI